MRNDASQFDLASPPISHHAETLINPQSPLEPLSTNPISPRTTESPPAVPPDGVPATRELDLHPQITLDKAMSTPPSDDETRYLLDLYLADGEGTLRIIFKLSRTKTSEISVPLKGRHCWLIERLHRELANDGPKDGDPPTSAGGRQPGWRPSLTRTGAESSRTALSRSTSHRSNERSGPSPARLTRQRLVPPSSSSRNNAVIAFARESSRS